MTENNDNFDGRYGLCIGQGQIFFLKIGKKAKKGSYLGGYFTYTLHTWYQGTIQ